MKGILASVATEAGVFLVALLYISALVAPFLIKNNAIAIPLAALSLLLPGIAMSVFAFVGRGGGSGPLHRLLDRLGTVGFLAVSAGFVGVFSWFTASRIWA